MSLLQPKVGSRKYFKSGDLSKTFPVISGVPIPVTLTAIVSAKELSCSITNCGRMAEE